jgi:hypothetical protein
MVIVHFNYFWIFEFFLARQPQGVLLDRFPPFKPCANEFSLPFSFFFFFLAFPFSPCWSIRYLAVGFFLFFLCAAGLRGTFPGHPHPPSLLLFSFWTTQHEIQHKHPWDLNPADLAVVSGECRSSFHHPTVSPY